MAKKDIPNDLLREARERLFGTQQALADAANELLPPGYLLTANAIGKLERSAVERPSAPRRKALRTVCRVETDAEIGLVRRRDRRGGPSAGTQMTTANPAQLVFEPSSAGLLRAEMPPSVLTAVAAPTGWRLVGYLAVHQEAPYGSGLSIFVPNAAQEPLIAELAPGEARPASSFPDLLGDPGEEWDSFLAVTRLLARQRQAVAPAALLSLVEAHRDCLAGLFRDDSALDLSDVVCCHDVCRG